MNFRQNQQNLIFQIQISPKMGSNNSKADSLHYEAKDWQETDRSVLYEVMKNHRGEEANLYHFNIKSDRDLDDEVEIYHSRKSNANWVQVIGANLSSSGFGFCGNQENANVLTEAIPTLLGSVSKLNKQQSAVVLYNALRGYSDLSRLVVPGNITENMIGFNRNGQTKVWVNENFGMNHPTNQSLEAHLDEAHLLDSLVNAVSPKLDLTPDFLNGVRNSRTILNALNFVKVNSGVPENVLEANRVNVASLGQQTSSILNSNVQVVPPTTYVQPTTSTVVTPTVYRPSVQTVNTGYVKPAVHFSHNNNTQLMCDLSQVRPVNPYVPQPKTKISFNSYQ